MLDGAAPASACATDAPARDGMHASRPVLAALVSAVLLSWSSAGPAQATSPSMVHVRGGNFAMGADGPLAMAHEGPVHTVTVGPFWIDATEVTVAQFAEFVRATGYTTEAEKYGWSGVFDMALAEWKRVDGADWRHPNGPQSRARPRHPVTHVSWNDARAYARWKGHRLPTEAEWEYAARGGLAGKTYSWGDELRPGGRMMANWWQGGFPARNTREDGYAGPAPVASFAANGYDMFDATGNVWEWVADRYAPDYYARSPARDPRGPGEGSERVMRGGSYLCASNFCSNYRVAGRSHATPDSGLSNVGFRTVKDDRPERRGD